MAIQLKFQCNESWEKMPTSEKGKFCGKCERNIHDLTDKSESEIHQLYNANKGKLCGKIKPQQLNNSMYQQYRTKLAKFCLALFLVFGGHIFKSEIKAQSNKINSKTTVQDNNAAHYIINGIVLEEETDEPLMFATVYYEVEGTLYRTTTNFDGSYILKINKRLVPSDSIDLNFKYIGYIDLKIVDLELNKSVHNVIHLKRKLHQQMTLGMIMINHNVIDRDPLSHGRTIITGEELRRSPF